MADSRIRDAKELAELLKQMAAHIVRDRRDDAPLRLIGIRSRGVIIAERLAQLLEPEVGEPVPVGAVDITLYRDDLGQTNRWPVLHGTEISFDVVGAEIVLVDDVLFTGRTVRAAINAICDLGRPACVRLAVLVDRGHRELPIQPEIVGLTVETDRAEQVRVRTEPLDPIDEIVQIRANQS